MRRVGVGIMVSRILSSNGLEVTYSRLSEPTAEVRIGSSGKAVRIGISFDIEGASFLCHEVTCPAFVDCQDFDVSRREPIQEVWVSEIEKIAHASLVESFQFLDGSSAGNHRFLVPNGGPVRGLVTFNRESSILKERGITLRSAVLAITTSSICKFRICPSKRS
jgi:hypothetical protein